MTFFSPFSLAAPPSVLSPLHGGELDVRYFDCSADLGAAGDLISSVGAVDITITRNDGFATTTGDLQLAPSSPVSLDATRLVLTVGLYAPQTAGGTGYTLTVAVNRTQQGRIYVRSFLIFVVPGVSVPIALPGQVGQHAYNAPANSAVFTTL